MEENKPPAKLKQAKLPFLKEAVNSSVKSLSQNCERKRRRSDTKGIESPNKTFKLSKPLLHIAPDNAECSHPKAVKSGKLSSISKTTEDNDNEVSSSSEAETRSGIYKSGNLESFVRKIQHNVHLEISSTNEILEFPSKKKKNTKVSEHQNLVDGDVPSVSDSTVSRDYILDSDVINSGKKNIVFHNQESILSSMNPTDIIVIDTSNEASISEIGEEIGKSSEKMDTEQGCTISSEDIAENLLLNYSQRHDRKGHKISGTEESVIEIDVKSSKSSEKINIEQGLTQLSEEIVENSLLNSGQIFDKKDDKEENYDNLLLSTEESDSSENNATYVLTTDGEDATVTPKHSVVKTSKRTPKINNVRKVEIKVEKQKLKNEKERKRSERKRKLEEEKAEKERIKREKKEAKDREKQEKKEKLEREKFIKEKAKQEERRKKEEEKIKKEEERRKKLAELEAKQEEKRKKEDERKLKEEERLREAEEKKKKEERIKQNFQNFFIKPFDSSSKPQIPKPSCGMFIPFEVKKDMLLAPAVRRDALSDEKRLILDQILLTPSEYTKTYLEQLRQGDFQPHKTGRILRMNPKPSADVEIIHYTEALKKVLHCVKLLQFHTDYRPPYCGTWRKQPKLSGRNPWKKDESVFDYEVDSDEEWEEEEPGESLSCSDGEEEKGDEAEDDDDDGWMVPHGYLSEDEGCNEDDETTPEKLKMQQLAKAKAWEEEQKQKFQAAPQTIVGCFFEHSPSMTMSGDVRLLYEFRGVVLMPTIPIPTNLFASTEPEVAEETIIEAVTSIPAQKGCPKMAVPSEAVPDLIRLVHGNPCGIKRLIKEFRVFWQRKINPGAPYQPEPSIKEEKLADSFAEGNTAIYLNESLNEHCNVSDSDKLVEKNGEGKSIEDGHGCNISKRQLELKITSLAVREKRPGFNKIIWYVHENILTQFNMADIKLPNTWEFVTLDLSKSPNLNTTMLSKKDDDGDKTEDKDLFAKPAQRDQRSIMEFARSKSELSKLVLEEFSPNIALEEVSEDLKVATSEMPIKDFYKKSANDLNFSDVNTQTQITDSYDTGS